MPLVDIRSLNDIGADSYLDLALRDILHLIPLPDRLKHELADVSDALSHKAFSVWGSIGPDDKSQGRGGYEWVTDGNITVPIYIKNTGDNKIIENNQHLLFPAFGKGPKGYFFDSPHKEKATEFPRKHGAQYLSDARMEFLHALRIMVDQVWEHSIDSVDGLIENGITIPVSVGKFRGLTDYLREISQHELEGSKWVWDENRELGSTVLITPSDKRTGTIDYTWTYDGILPTYMSLLRNSGAVMTIFSAHAQNFYDAPHSLSSQADNCDLLFTDDLDNHQKAQLFVGSLMNLTGRGLVKSGFGLGAFMRPDAFVEEYARQIGVPKPRNMFDLVYAALKNQPDHYIPSQKLLNRVVSFNYTKERKSATSLALMYSYTTIMDASGVFHLNFGAEENRRRSGELLCGTSGTEDSLLQPIDVSYASIEKFDLSKYL